METINYNILEHKKIQLITLISQLYSLDLIEEIENLIISNKKDWWHSISMEERRAIEIGLDDVKQGKLLTHEQVMNEVNERYRDL